ncbi:hypothetical protein ACP70R_020099 [Stipagrostis hirtigluma subsp. patula]
MEPTRGADHGEVDDARRRELEEWRERETRITDALYEAALRAQAEIDAHFFEYQRRTAERERERLRGVPASCKAILALRVPTAREAAGQDCAVCLDGFEEGDEIRTMPCSHHFHQFCIYTWLSSCGACPCCRFRLPSEEQQRLLDEQEAAVQAGAGVAATAD